MFPNWAFRCLAGRLPQSPGAHQWASKRMRDTYVCIRTSPTGRLLCTPGEGDGTHTGWSRGLARLHLHLLQKQKWQPHQHGCDSSPGQTAPAVTAKTLAPTGAALGTADAIAKAQTSPCAQGSGTSQAPEPYRMSGAQGDKDKTVCVCGGVSRGSFPPLASPISTADMLSPGQRSLAFPCCPLGRGRPEPLGSKNP